MRVTSIGLLLICLASRAAVAEETPPDLCALVVHDVQRQLEGARLQVRLARAGLEAYETIFTLIEGLRDAKAVDKMTYLRARYDRDAARLALERADLVLVREAAFVEQYRLTCEIDDGGDEASRAAAMADAYRRYIAADCDQQAKAIEVARTNLEFDTSFRDSILDLREGQVATRQDVIVAELDVRQDTLRLEDAQTRTAACRAKLAGLAAREKN